LLFVVCCLLFVVCFCWFCCFCLCLCFCLFVQSFGEASTEAGARATRSQCTLLTTNNFAYVINDSWWVLRGMRMELTARQYSRNVRFTNLGMRVWLCSATWALNAVKLPVSSGWHTTASSNKCGCVASGDVTPFHQQVLNSTNQSKQRSLLLPQNTSGMWQLTRSMFNDRVMG